MKISLMLGNLRQPFEESLHTVQRLNIPAIHLSAGGMWNPATCDAACRKRLRALLRRRGLVISALSRWGGEVDLGEVSQADQNIADARRTLEMAADLMAENGGPGIWQAHIGVMPRTADGPRWDSFVHCARAIARHGEKVGACLAVETGPEPPIVVEKLMHAVESPGLRVNYDPANLILWPALLRTVGRLVEKFGKPPTPYDKETAIREFEPVEGVRRLGRYIVHTHAKDARVEGGVDRESPLGQGWVDWPRYLRLLKENGYQGYLAIERETGADPVADIAAAAEFLRAQLRLLQSGGTEN